MSKKLLGAHLSTTNGLHNLPAQMNKISANTYAFFLKNQRRYASSPLTEPQIRSYLNSTPPPLVLPHGSYLINLANTTDSYHKMYDCFTDELKRCQQLQITLYNLHPGSAIDTDRQKSLCRVAESINRAHRDVPGVCVVIENMAGQGRTLGATFEELRTIVEKVSVKERIGVCLDTCHLFGAGYDIRTEQEFKRTFRLFGEQVGFDYLKGMHLNDSMYGLGSRKDRHENLGKGEVGWEAFRMIMGDERFDGIPMILETRDVSLYSEEIKTLREFENKN